MTPLRSNLLALPGKSQGWFVYCHFAADGDVLYVGCSSDVRHRQYSHRYRSSWWSEVAQVSVVGPWRVKRTALGEERALIAALNPPHNVMDTSRAAAVYERMVETNRARHGRSQAVAS